MADTLSEHKEGGDDGKSNTVVPLRDESFRLQCDPSGEHSQDPQAQEETKLHSSELQQGKCESIRLPLIETKDAKSCEEATNKHGELTDEDEREAGASSKRQEDERGLDIDESKVTKINLSQAKDPPEGENSQAEEKKLMMEHSESSPQTGALCETLSVNITSESPPALNDSSTCEPSPPSPSPLPAHALKKSDIYSENGSSSVDGCQESSESLSKAILPSTGIQPDTDLDSSSIVSNDQEKLIEVTAESQVLSKRSLHIAPSETVGNELDSTQLSSGSSASDLYSSKEVQHNVDDSPSQSSQLSFTTTETDTTHQESGDKMAIAISVNLSQDKETEPHSQVGNTYSPQSAENVSLEKSIVKNVDTEGNESLIENEVAGNPENRAAQSETELEKLESSNNPNSVSEMTTEILPQIVATRSLSQDQGIENESTYKERPTEPAALEMEATKVRIVPSLEPEPLKPVTIGSSLQPLEEVQEASIVEEASFSTDMAIIDSSADEADSIGGLVINNVIGAADGVADFQPDEVETERELTDISASAPQLDEGSDSGDEHGPSAKRRKLENEPNIGTEKLNSAKKVILRVIPVKNGHGVWDSQKLQEVLLSKGTILLQIHASKESMEMFEPDKNDEKVDFTAIMGEAKDEGHSHVLSFGNVEPDYDDPLSVSTSLRDTTSPPTFSRPFSHPHSRSTALQPAMSRPGFKHLQTPQQYHMKNEVFGLPPPLEFEEPQMNPSDWSGLGFNSKMPMQENSSLLYGTLYTSPQGIAESGHSVRVTKVCRLCDVTLANQEDFAKHQNCVLLSCRKCQFQAKTLDSFNEHMKSHQTKYLEQKCNICQEVFSSPITHAVHKRKIHGVYDCKHCSAEFLSKTDWSNHMKQFHNEKNVKSANLVPTSKQEPSNQRKLLVRNMSMIAPKPPPGLIMSSPQSISDTSCPTGIQTASDLCSPQMFIPNTPTKPSLTLNYEEGFICKEEPLETENAVPHTFLLRRIKPNHKRKRSRSTKLLGVPCKSCSAVFKNLTTLRIHIKQKHTEKPKCPACGVTRSTLRKVFQHQITAHKKKLRCRHYCLALFDTPEELSAHHISVHNKDHTLMKCRYCRNTYTRGTYEEHLQKCHGEIRCKRIKTCPACDRKFVDLPEYSRHLKTCDSSMEVNRGESSGMSTSVEIKPIIKTEEELECDANKFDTQPILMNKKSVKSIGKPSRERAKNIPELINTNQEVTKSLKCRFCPQMFDREENGVSHMVDEHKTVFAHMKEYKVCDICGKLFLSGLSLCKHLVKHYEKCGMWNNLVPSNFTMNDIRGRCWVCKTSGVSYSTFHYNARNSIIDKHISSKACRKVATKKDGGFHCSFCKETIPDIHEFWNHIKIHLSRFPSVSKEEDQFFSCPRCPLKYRKEAQLMEHVALHLIQQDIHGETKELSDNKGTVGNSEEEMNKNLSNKEFQEETNDTGLEIDTSADNIGTFKCLHCKKIFGIKNDALQHLLSSHSKVLKEIITGKDCHMCNKSFIKGSALCSHILKHYIKLGMWEDMVPRNLLSKIDKQHCWICGTVLRDKKSKHHNRRNDVIEKTLSSRSEELKDDEPFQCPLCEFSCSNRYAHWKHIRLHVFRSRNSLSKIESEPKVELPTPAQDSEKKIFNCLKCKKEFSEMTDFRKHLATHFLRKCKVKKRKLREIGYDEEQEAKKRKPMTLRSKSLRSGQGNMRCVCCSLTFNSSEDAVYHVLFAHKSIVTQGKEHDLVCKMCGASFKGEWWLCKHIINHYVNMEMWNALIPRDLANNLNARNQCWICKCMLDKNYVGHTSKRNAYVGVLISKNCKEEDSLFECSLCNLGFPTRMKYWQHMWSHFCKPPSEYNSRKAPSAQDRKKDYECSDCSLYFQNENELNKHLALHFLEYNDEEKSGTSCTLEEHQSEEVMPREESSDEEWLPPSMVKRRVQEDDREEDCQEEMEVEEIMPYDKEAESFEEVAYDSEANIDDEEYDSEAESDVSEENDNEGDDVDVAHDEEGEGDENLINDIDHDCIIENIKCEDESSSWFE